jgi:hypothetical protein
MSATVLLEEDDAPQPRPMALMKGAPEVVRQFLKQVISPATILHPCCGWPGFDRVSEGQSIVT